MHHVPASAHPLRLSRWLAPAATLPRSAAAQTISATPWWQWWNLLSLDAPSVAVVWAFLFARCFGTPLPLAEAAVLFLTVWVIYVSDRLLDARHAANLYLLQSRHRFSKRLTPQLLCLAGLAAAIALWLATKFLSPREIRSGVCLSAAVLLYLLTIHGRRGTVLRAFPKEMMVGALFAAGTSLPVWAEHAELRGAACLPILLFALLCSLNCVAIECWETTLADVPRLEVSQWVRWASSRLNLLALALAALACAALLANPLPSSPSLFLASALGALLILFLNVSRYRYTLSALRVLVDAALLFAGLLFLVRLL